MAKSYEELLNQANEVSNETQYGANTAPRVGGLNADIIEKIQEVEDKISTGGIELVKSTSSSAPSDDNIFTALAALKKFISKDKEDTTYKLLTLAAGAIFGRQAAQIDEQGIGTFNKVVIGNHQIELDSTGIAKFGEFIDSLIAGKGTGIFPNGRIQTDRIEVRGSAVFKEVVMNRWSAQEGNVTYSEAGTIERVDLMPDGTYDLYLRRRWDNDVTALAEHDICFGSVNDLFGSGAYYDSWFRVLNVMQAENKISVTLYPDEEVPGGVNHEPQVGMAITRRGNVVNEQRQGYWYISSYEGCVCFLDGVTKPILEESNYSVIIGRLKRLEIFTNLPINYLHSYVYCRGIAVQDLHRIDYQGTPVRQENFRGFWSREVAETEPYQSTSDRYDTVSHLGCEWMCLISGTLDEPKYGCTGWAMIRGNPAFTIELTSTNNWEFDADRIAQRDESGDYIPFTSLVVTGWLYNQDVTESILDSDVTWARDTGNATEDNAWAIRRADAGKTLPLTVDDLGTDYLNRTSCTFKVTALLRDGQKFEVAEDYMTF